VNAIGAPVITQHPADQAVFEGQNATFNVTATGFGPFLYQWQRDGFDIVDATGSSYTTAAATLADDGATFRCLVSNESGTTPSNAGTLTVNAGLPRVTTGLQVFYTFDEGSGATIRDVSGVGQSLDLTIGDLGSVSWLSGGLSINSSTLLSSSGPAAKVISSVQSSNSITVEAWVKPSNVTQTGPARMVTLSENPSRRNMTLGQESDGYDVRLRTTSTSANGIPSLGTGSGVATLSLTHVVYTRDVSGGVRLYVNGVEVSSGVVSGDLSNWVSSYSLGLGNELTGDRPWLGAFHLVAIYSRALTSAEVLQNYTAGADGTGSAAPSITQHPTDQSIFEGQNATFNVAATGVGALSYQWQRDGENIIGATSSSYTTGAMSLSDNGRTYRCVVSNTGGSTVSNAATLTVNAIGAPVITQHPADQALNIN